MEITNKTPIVMLTVGQLKQILREVLTADGAKIIAEQTRLQIETEVAAQSTESYLTRQQVVNILSIDKSTLWRWGKRNYLNPVRVGGLVRYRKSDIDNILNSGK